MPQATAEFFAELDTLDEVGEQDPLVKGRRIMLKIVRDDTSSFLPWANKPKTTDQQMEQQLAGLISAWHVATVLAEKKDPEDPEGKLRPTGAGVWSREKDGNGWLAVFYIELEVIRNPGPLVVVAVLAVAATVSIGAVIGLWYTVTGGDPLGAIESISGNVASSSKALAIAAVVVALVWFLGPRPRAST